MIDLGGKYSTLSSPTLYLYGSEWVRAPHTAVLLRRARAPPLPSSSSSSSAAAAAAAALVLDAVLGHMQPHSRTVAHAVDELADGTAAPRRVRRAQRIVLVGLDRIAACSARGSARNQCTSKGLLLLPPPPPPLWGVGLRGATRGGGRACATI